MKKRIFWLTMCCLVVVLLVVSSCQSAPTTPTTTTATTTTTTQTTTTAATTTTTTKPTTTAATTTPAKGWVSGTPQYGGTLTLAPYYVQGHIDPRYSEPWRQWQCDLVYDRLVNVDYSRGPSGTGEIAFAAPFGNPSDFTGMLAESWTQPDLYTVNITLRQGIKWSNLDPANGRELTAQDVVNCFNANNSYPQWWFYDAPDKAQKKTMTATGKYTLTLKFPAPSFRQLEDITAFLPIFSNDALVKFGSLADWKSQVGTGPFTISDYVADSQMTLKRNPNYWEMDPFNPKNQLPYIDSINIMVVADAATRLAALRTGKVDHQRAIDWKAADTLKASYPDLQFKKLLQTSCNRIMLKKDVAKKEFEPFMNQKVRYALSMAIDYKGIVDNYYKGNAVLFAAPIRPDCPEFVPLSEFPASVQEIYSYNPTKAKQLLAEAGFPSGFTFKAACVTDYVEQMNILQSYWDAIGVKMELTTWDQTTWQSTITAGGHPPVTFNYSGLYPNALQGMKMFLKGDVNNYGKVDDATFNDMYTKASSELNEAARIKLIKDMGKYAVEKAWDIFLPSGMNYCIWWPWLKNYHGEMDFYYQSWPRYVYIDQALKKSLGK